jgi:hypothetical protein
MKTHLVAWEMKKMQMERHAHIANIPWHQTVLASNIPALVMLQCFTNQWVECESVFIPADRRTLWNNALHKMLGLP